MLFYHFKWIIYKNIYKVIKDKKIKYSRGIYFTSWKERKKIKEYNKSVNALKGIFSARYTEENFEFLQYVSNNEESIEADISANNTTLLSKVRGAKKKSINKTYTKTEFIN